MRKRRKRWAPPPAMTAAVDPEEFKFCCALMEAGYGGKMRTPKPTEERVIVEDFGEVSLTDIPMNRAMLAVREHFRETRPEAQQNEFVPMGMRLMFFADFVRSCLKSRDHRMDKFFEVRGSEIVGIETALLEAAAVGRLGPHGFYRRELFAEAARRLRSRIQISGIDSDMQRN